MFYVWVVTDQEEVNPAFFLALYKDTSEPKNQYDFGDQFQDGVWVCTN